MEVKFTGVMRGKSDIDTVVNQVGGAAAVAVGAGVPTPSLLPGVTGNALRVSADAITLITLPPYKPGDIVVAVSAWANGPSVPATPAGWSLLASNPGVTGPGFVAWGKLMNGSEGSTLAHGTVIADAVAVAVTCVRAAFPLVAANMTASFPGVINPNVVAPAVSSTAPGQLLLSFYVTEDAAGGGPTTITPPAAQAPMQFGINAVVTGKKVAIRSAWERLSSTGSTGSRTASSTGATAAASVTGCNVLVGQAE